MKAVKRVLSVMLVLAMLVTSGIIPANASDTSVATGAESYLETDISNENETDTDTDSDTDAEGDAESTGTAVSPEEGDISTDYTDDMEMDDTDVTPGDVDTGTDVTGDAETGSTDIVPGDVETDTDPTGDVDSISDDSIDTMDEMYSNENIMSLSLDDELSVVSDDSVYDAGDYENGLPTRGYKFINTTDPTSENAYTGSAEFVAKISHGSYGSNSDIVAQVYTSTLNDDGTKTWEAKKDENDNLVKTWISAESIPNDSEISNRIKNGATIEFTLESGEMCFIYPVETGTGMNTMPNVKTTSYSYDYYVTVGLKSAEEYEISQRTSSMSTNCCYNGWWYNEIESAEVQLAKQKQMQWAEQDNGLPNAGLQIQYDIEDDENLVFTDYANIQLDITGWRYKDNGVPCLWYNGESNLGAKTEEGYGNVAGLLYRVELYKKIGENQYIFDRNLTDHLYLLDPSSSTYDSASVLNSFKDQLKNEDVQSILKNGGVISIVPLKTSNLSYGEMTGENELAEAEYAPVFGYDFIIAYNGKSSDYAVSVTNMANSVGSQTNKDGNGQPLQTVTIKVTSEEKVEQGLVIDGEGIPEGTTQHLYIQLDPKTGYNYDGKTALRFLARVYKKNADGTYTAKPITSATHCVNWDYVQRDTESANQAINYTTNFDWQDNRYIECELASDEVVMIYPVAWDDTKSNWQWYPYAQYSYSDSARYLKAFQEIDQPYMGEWAFSYKIGVKDTYDTLLVGGTCENGNVSVKNGVLSSSANVSNGEVQKVKLQLITEEDVSRLNSYGNPAEIGSVDGGLVLQFDGLEDINNLDYDTFRKNMIIYLKTTANGMNGARMGGAIREDQVYFNAIYYDADGNWFTEKIYWYSNGETNYIGSQRLQQFTLEDMTEDEYNVLKNGGSLVIYPVVKKEDIDSYNYTLVGNKANARFYSFDYAFVCRTDTEVFKIDTITDNTGNNTTTLKKDELGIYNGAQTLSYEGVRKSNVTISLVENENAGEESTLGFTELNLPNHGLIFTVGDVNGYSYSSFSLDIEISAPREKKNGENPLEESYVDVMLFRYQPDGAGGYYCAEMVTSSKLTAKYPGSTCYTGTINYKYFKSGTQKSVYVLIPVAHDDIPNFGGYFPVSDPRYSPLVEEFGFDVKITGLRTRASSIVSIQTNANEIDPYDYDAEGWETINGTGPYEDRFDFGTLSSDGNKLLNLRINVKVNDNSENAVQGLASTQSDVYYGNDLTPEKLEAMNAVIIRNSANGYEADNGSASKVNSDLTAGDLPDVQVSIIASSQKGDNAAIGWGYYISNSLQLPYQAFLYNYSEGTYEKIGPNGSYSSTNYAPCYYSFDDSDNPIKGPASTQWGVYPGQTSTFHTHLADDQAIVIVPTSNYFNFTYQVSIRNSDQYTVESYTVNGGEFLEKRENLYQSGTITNVESDSADVTNFQEVVLKTAVAESEEGDQNKTFNRLSESLPSGQTMRNLSVTLFDYNFPGLTATDFSGQPSMYKFLLDPLNNYDYGWNHIGDIKTLVYAGILQDTLGEDGLPVFNYSVPFNIFSKDEVTTVTNGGTKEVYPSQFEFVYDEATSTYSYNSHLHHAQLEEDGVVYQYDKGLGLEDWGNQSAGFFPYNDWKTTEGKWGSVNNDNANTYLVDQDDLNYHFGMSMEQEFTIPLDGTIKGNDMVFKISGDDDIWMFIDGKLVLDIGGIHEAVKGEINFTKGTYTVNGVEHQLSEVLTDYSVDEFGGTTGAWAFGTEHTFEFFYLERGGTLSNMDISFNLPVYKTTTIEKEVVSGIEADKNAAYKFEVSLFADDNGTTPYAGLVYLVDEDGNKTAQKVKNGKFEVTIDTVDGKGQISFLTQEECTSYSVKEIGSDAFTTTWKKMTDAGSADVSEGSITKAGTTLTCVNTRSFGNLEISKTLTSYNTSLKEVTFVFQVEAVNAKGKTVYSNVVSTTHSAAGTKKVVIEDLPEGATVTVTEIYGGASYEATGSKEVKVQIVGGDTVSAEFTNTYDDKLVPGYGVTNHFELDENNDWQWSQLKDNSVE